MEGNDFQRRLRRLSEEASPRPGSAQDVLRRGRVRRRVAAVGAGLMAIVLIGAVAGGAVLLGDQGPIDPAPGPEETTGCIPPEYDIAVFVPPEATQEEIANLASALEADDRVASAEFVDAEEAADEFRRENPDHEGQLPTGASDPQFRLQVVQGVDPHRASGHFADLGGAGALAPAADCPPAEPETRFARYFFEVAERGTSASGTLEVDWRANSVCLDADITGRVMASHLLMEQRPGSGAQSDLGFPAAVLTFFDPDGRSADSNAPDAHCLRGKELGQLESELHVLLDRPELFRIDFHRGPNDDPGLVAKLRTERAREIQRCPFPELTPTYLPWLDRGQEPGRPLRSYDTDANRAELAWRDPSGAGIFVSLSPQELPEAQERTDLLVDQARGYFHQGEGGDVYISWDVGGRCNLLQLGGSLPAVERAKVKNELMKIARSLKPRRDAADPPNFDSISDAIRYISDRLPIPVALPRDLPADARLDPRLGVTVDSEGGVTSASLKLRFGDKGILGFQFGRAMFDGCGGDGAVEVDIEGAPGLMLAKDELPWTQIIWPANLGDREATYGIYGSLAGDEMLELARSMELGLDGDGEPAGC